MLGVYDIKGKPTVFCDLVDVYKRQVDGIVLRCREEMIHQAGKDSLPL